MWEFCGLTGISEQGESHVGGNWESAGAVAEAQDLNTWDLIKAKLAERIAPQEFQNWVMRTALESFDHGSLRVQVPDQVTKDFIEQEYTEQIRSTIRELNLPIESVVYLPHAEPRTASDPSPAPAPLEPAFSPAAGLLNTRFRFDNFVVGSCNQFAHAAARAVADSPSRSYNPLFIYGGTGMGKTHLMHAIGRELLDRYPAIRVVYTSSERFMNEMILCLRTNRMPSFQRHYRTADVLLVDDVQILAGKERMQEEFFHTFNELYDHQKQIVISSDSAPKSTSGLVERLRSRFEWGLMVDVQPPDLETKMAILDKKAELEGIALPEEVRIYIATKTKSNVRELEGALIKLIAYSSITNSPITLQMAQQVLKYLISGGERRITMDSILRAVAEKFSMQPQQLKQKSNARQISYPRQVAMYLMKDLTQASLPEIGRVFGGKHHTTVLHSVQKIERLRQTDTDLNRLIHSLIDSVH
jgi:chromosomal replication initiator protein